MCVWREIVSGMCSMEKQLGFWGSITAGPQLSPARTTETCREIEKRAEDTKGEEI